ncbi:hypothetical protein COL922a_014483, partial [Colletotrichum nupharicola]
STGKGLYRYHVDVKGGSSTKALNVKKRKQVFRLLLEEHFPQLRKSIVTDYRSTLISHVKVLDQDNVEVTFDVRYRGDYEDEYPENPEVFRVSCQYTGQVDPASLLNYLTSSDASAMFESKEHIVQALNIAIGYQPKSADAIASIGANKHYAIHDGLAEKFNLGSGLEALRGYF